MVFSSKTSDLLTGKGCLTAGKFRLDSEFKGCIKLVGDRRPFELKMRQLYKTLGALFGLVRCALTAPHGSGLVSHGTVWLSLPCKITKASVMNIVPRTMPTRRAVFTDVDIPNAPTNEVRRSGTEVLYAPGRTTALGGSVRCFHSATSLVILSRSFMDGLEKAENYAPSDVAFHA